MSKLSLLVLFFLTTITLIIILLAPFVHDKPVPQIVSGASLLVICFGLALMIRYGLVRAAAITLVAILWIFFTAVTILGGGIESPGLINYFIVIVIAGLLLGGLTGISLAALCIVTGIALLISESYGLVPRATLPTTDSSLIMTYSINYAMIALLLFLAKRSTEDSMLHALKSEHALAESNKDLAIYARNLEKNREALRESELRYHRLFENSPIPLWEEDFSQVKKYIDQLRISGVTDFKTYFTQHPEDVQHCAKLIRVLDVNQSSLDLLGAKKKVDVIKSVSRILGYEASDMFRDELIALIEGNTTFDAEAIQTTLTGEKIYTVANIAVAPGYEKDWSKVFVSSLDVTQRKRVEQVLRTLNDAALAVEEALTPDGIFEAMGEALRKLGYSCAVFLLDNDDSELTIRYFNYENKLAEAALKLTGVDISTFAIPVDRVDVFSEVIRDRRTLLVEGIEPVIQILPNKKKGLAAQLVKMLQIPKSILAPLITEDKVIGMLTVQSDSLTQDDRPAVTAFAHQMAAARHKAMLLEDLKKSLRDLKITQQQLLQSQKMEAIGKLAGGIAHDFNNLLTAIIGYTDLMLKHQKDDDSFRVNLLEIKKAAGRAATLTSQLLAFSRKQVLQPQVLNLNTVVESITAMLTRLIGEDIELKTKLYPNLDAVKADPGQIEQVLMNLAVNARDAMPHGGKLTIETMNQYIDESNTEQLTEVKPGAYVILSFIDTGVGMDAETKSRVFEPFFTTKKHGEGTGLGLSTVYGIVKQSGGYITVGSTLGKGSTFKIFLPRVDDKGKAKWGARHSSGHLRGIEQVLLVEDEEMVRSLVQSVLEEYGYHVTTASQADEAYRLCRETDEPFQLMITDVVMPGTMSGHDLADRLSDLYPALRVLFMSGYTENNIVHHGFLDPKIHFIQKPFTPVSLLSKLREVLDSDNDDM